MNNSIPTAQLFGKETPKLGIGTWGIGGYMQKNAYSDYVNEISQIKYQLNKGLTLIDCWLAQGEGNSVELIRQSIDEYDRSKLTLLCKFDIQKYSGLIELETIFDRYLAQLRTSYLDVFQLHVPNFSKISEKEIETFLQKKIADGSVKHFAVSNATITELKHIKTNISVPIAANEVLYNLFERSYEEDGTVDYCKNENIPIIAYRPLNRGMTNILSQNKVIQSIISETSLTPNQIALQWLLQKHNVSVLVKSSNRAHISENLDCMRNTLNEAQVEQLDNWTL